MQPNPKDALMAAVVTASLRSSIGPQVLSAHQNAAGVVFGTGSRSAQVRRCNRHVPPTRARARSMDRMRNGGTAAREANGARRALRPPPMHTWA